MTLLQPEVVEVEVGVEVVRFGVEVEVEVGVEVVRFGVVVKIGIDF